MTTYLTVDDLAHFLRGRKSDLCRIGADFVEDHPEHPAVRKALESLERYASRFAAARYFDWDCRHITGTLSEWTRKILVLTAIAGRTLDESLVWTGWYDRCLERAKFWVHRTNYGIGWAAAIVRILKPTKEKNPWIKGEFMRRPRPKG